ncbi:hypothetical protein Leryth_021778 [Lithospermum erythrorhizon]|nr:hypothetical protein Leryth_021778 [Lithospermum erythrorhizon]
MSYLNFSHFPYMSIRSLFIGGITYTTCISNTACIICISNTSCITYTSCIYETARITNTASIFARDSSTKNFRISVCEFNHILNQSPNGRFPEYLSHC